MQRMRRRRGQDGAAYEARTRDIVVRVFPIYAAEEEIRVFTDSTECMRRGYSGTFDELEALLATR